MRALTQARSSDSDSDHNLSAGIWRLADPKISLASFASMFLGASAAASAGSLNWFWLGLTVVGIFALEVAKNASGEIYDFDSGADQAVEPADRSPFSGGKRVLVDKILSREETRCIAWAGYALGCGIGFAIAFLRAPGVAWIGVIGVLLAFQYHAPPLRLAYRGLGELAVGVVYGPLIASGTYLVQAGTVPVSFLMASVPLGLLIAGFLWVNEFPDYRADKAAGKRTLVVRLGRPRAARVFAGIQVLAFVLIAAAPIAGLPAGMLLGLLAAIPGMRAVFTLLHDPENISAIIPAQRDALAAFLLAAIFQGIGVFKSG